MYIYMYDKVPVRSELTSKKVLAYIDSHQIFWWVRMRQIESIHPQLYVNKQLTVASKGEVDGHTDDKDNQDEGDNILWPLHYEERSFILDLYSEVWFLYNASVVQEN